MLYRAFFIGALLLFSIMPLLFYVLQDVFVIQDVFFRLLTALLELIVPLVIGIVLLDTYLALPSDDRSRPFWLLSALAFFCWGGIGGGYQLVFFFVHPTEEVPYPSFSDIGYLLFIPLLCLALWRLQVYIGIPAPLWGKIAAGLLLLLSFGFYFQWVWIDSELLQNFSDSTPLTLMTEAAYTLLDPLLVALAILTAVRLGFSPASMPFWLFLFGIFAYFAANTIYTYLEYHGAFVTFSLISSLLYVGWFGGFTLMAIAAVWFQSLTEEP